MLPLSAVAAIISCGNFTSGLCRCRQKTTRLHVFVWSRPDYYNALLHGVADGLYRRLQNVRPERRGATCIRVYGAVVTSGRPYYVSTGYPYNS